MCVCMCIYIYIYVYTYICSSTELHKKRVIEGLTRTNLFKKVTTVVEKRLNAVDTIKCAISMSESPGGLRKRMFNFFV